MRVPTVRGRARGAYERSHTRTRAGRLLKNRRYSSNIIHTQVRPSERASECERDRSVRTARRMRVHNRFPLSARYCSSHARAEFAAKRLTAAAALPRLEQLHPEPGILVPALAGRRSNGPESRTRTRALPSTTCAVARIRRTALASDRSSARSAHRSRGQPTKADTATQGRRPAPNVIKSLCCSCARALGAFSRSPRLCAVPLLLPPSPRAMKTKTSYVCARRDSG